MGFTKSYIQEFLKLAEIINDILPKWVVNIIHDQGQIIGNQLINSVQREEISETDSSATGMAAIRATSNQIHQVMVVHA